MDGNILLKNRTGLIPAPQLLLSLRVSFGSKCQGYFLIRSHDKKGMNRKVLPKGISMHGMKVQSLTVQKLWPMLRFYKSRSQVKVNVKSSKLLVSTNRISMPYMNFLSFSVQKLWPRLIFFSKVRVC